MQMLPSIVDGHVVVRLGGEIDAQSAAAVVQVIEHSRGEFSLDFTDVGRIEDAGFSVLADAIKRCPYRLMLRGFERLR